MKVISKIFVFLGIVVLLYVAAIVFLIAANNAWASVVQDREGVVKILLQLFGGILFISVGIKANGIKAKYF